MDYEYKNQHFSVEIAEALLREQQVSTTSARVKEIREYLFDRHKKRGGFGLPDSVENDFVDIEEMHITQTALLNLHKQAMTSRIYKDIWRIARRDQWIFGKGKHWVYLYYFDQDKNEAESKGEVVWRCKIGKADGLDKDDKIKYDAPETRVESQTRGAPVKPILALLLRTDLHTILERVVHGTLTLQGKHLPKAQGKEWFRTNPSEVVSIVAMIDFGLLSPVLNLSPILENFERNVK